MSITRRASPIAAVAVTIFVSIVLVAAQGGGAFTGRVLHSDGTPAVAVGVGALPVPNPECVPAPYGIQTSPGNFSALSARVLTDGAGRYRLENIPPGRYYVAAGLSRLPGQGASPCFAQGRYGSYIVEPTYLPGVPDRSSATAMTITTGDSPVPDLRLPAPSSASGLRVSGRVVGTPSVRAGGALTVRLANRGVVPANGPCKVQVTNVGPDGSFELRNVPPCTYVAAVIANYGDTGRGAFPGVDTSINVDVSDKDVTGLVLGPR
jgi:hypothetical protein